MGRFIFGDRIDGPGWLSLLQTNGDDFTGDFEASEPALFLLHALCHDPKPEKQFDLVEGLRSETAGAALALALLAEDDPEALTAYTTLASQFPDLPASPPTRAQLQPVLAALLEIVVPELVDAADVADDTDLVGGDDPEVDPDTDAEPENPSQSTGDAGESMPEPIEQIQRTGERGSFDQDDLAAADTLLESDWEHAAEVAASLHGQLRDGLVPDETNANWLARFAAQAGELARSLDSRAREELRKSLVELRRHNVGPARRWLMRLAAMTGPEELLDSIQAVAAVADEAALLPEHERDEALRALLTLIDIAADRAAGRHTNMQSAFGAEETARAGIPEHPQLVFAASAGYLTVPASPALPADVHTDPAHGRLMREEANTEFEDAQVGAPSEVVAEPEPEVVAEPEPEVVAEPEPEVAALPDDGLEVDLESASEGNSGDDEPAPAPAAGSAGLDGPEAAVAAVAASLPALVGDDSGPEPAPGAEPQPEDVDERGHPSGAGVPQAAAPEDAEPDTPGFDERGDGQPTQITELVGQGRERLAYLIAKDTGVDDAQLRALKLFVGANGCQAERLLGDLSDIWLDHDQLAQLNANESRLVLAAGTRLALSLGFDPTGQLATILSSTSLEDYAASAELSDIVRMAARGFQRPTTTATSFDLAGDQWRNIAEAADDALTSLRGSRLNFQRASKIIHHLARDNEPLGAHLRLLTALANDYAAGRTPTVQKWTEFEDFSKKLQDIDEQAQLLEEADRQVSSTSQLRHPIVAGSKKRLYALVGSVASLSAEAVALRARAVSVARRGSESEVNSYLGLRNALGPVTVTTVGDAALARLVEWIGEDEPPRLPSTTVEELLAGEVAPLYEIQRDENDRPMREPTGEELRVLIDGRDALQVVRGYLARGNRRAAEAYLVSAGVPRTDALEDEVRESAHALRKQYEEVLGDVTRIVSHVRALSEDADERDDVLSLAGRLAALEKLESDDRLDLTFRSLEEVRQEASAVLEKSRTTLRGRAQKVANNADRERIAGLIESGDETLAVEYLTLAEAKIPLPHLERISADDFEEFFPKVVQAADDARKTRGNPLLAVRTSLGLEAVPDHDRLSTGLRAWRALALNRNDRGQRLRENLADVLRMIGLNPDPSNWLKETLKTRSAGFASYSLSARPIDRSYVPQFGTKALGKYHLTLVWENVVNPQKLLQYVEVNRYNEPNIILYLGTLSVDQRVQLRKLTTRPGFEFSPLVIDDAVIAWISTREEPAWRLTQRVTLPFTTINPYTPFAGGEVPDEVFVGREKERGEIIDPHGSMFVYGGRQLGKSALLRRVERGLNGSTLRQSGTNLVTVVYFDLKSANLGEAAPASELWPELATRLQKVGVLASRRQKWTADAVVAGIETWLDADPSRRLLLLLDEADNFLTYDANDTAHGGVGGFPVLQRLKGLMENSQRRFKPVFAGLHQVQRFHDLPNTPVAHGGNDTLIGPLTFADAQQLVADPLRALGFKFESPETIWRLLLLTNYQASLIQIVCEALVDHMRTTNLPKDGGRIVITNRHVEEVYSKGDVRDRIRERFRWTINLDNRYRVIALVTALLTYEVEAGEPISSTELQEACASFWAAGFQKSTLSSSEFRRYLEEMRGLGVLHRQDNGDYYVLRSPNIRGLLGTKQQIEDELLEASENLEVAYQYNPTMNRRILKHAGTGERELRAPLPDAELTRLLDHKDSIQLVIGTPALGLDRVAQALKEVAPSRSLDVVEVSYNKLATKLRTDLSRHLIVDLTGDNLTAADVGAALDRLADTPGVYATVIIRADSDFDVTTALDRFPSHVSLTRWSEDGLGAWQDSAFTTPSLRKELKRFTGGWLEKVELAMQLVAEGTPRQAALHEVLASVRTEDGARNFLKSAGVPLALALPWVREFRQLGEDGLWEVPPLGVDMIELIDGLPMAAGDAVALLQLVDAVDETPDGVVLDRLIVEAADALLP